MPNILKICLKTRNVNSSIIFGWRTFILSTMIAYEVQMTTEISDHRYDLGVEGQGQKYINSVKGSEYEVFLFFDGVCSY